MIRKKLRNAVLILAGACMLAGTVTSYAAVPEDLWKYDMSTSQDGTITYQFKEVSISLPRTELSLISLRKFPFRFPPAGSGKCGMSIGDSSITFYHLASRQAHLNDSEAMGAACLPWPTARTILLRTQSPTTPSSAAGRAASITSPSPRIYRATQMTVPSGANGRMYPPR